MGKVRTVQVPRLNDEPADLAWLAKVAQQVGAGEDLTLDFRTCDFVRYAGVAAIGGLVRLGEVSGSKVVIAESTLQSQVRAYDVLVEPTCASDG